MLCHRVQQIKPTEAAKRNRLAAIKCSPIKCARQQILLECLFVKQDDGIHLQNMGQQYQQEFFFKLSNADASSSLNAAIEKTMQ